MCECVYVCMCMYVFMRVYEYCSLFIFLLLKCVYVKDYIHTLL